MSTTEIALILSKYIPASCVQVCTSWITNKNIHLKITRGRSSKYGDYRPHEKGDGHHITVNHDLNPFSFLITFVHEVAHLHCFIRYKHRHEPHGREWKEEFRILLSEFIRMKVFPEDIESALNSYIQNPAASSCSDMHLHRTLKKYDPKGPEEIFHLEDLEQGEIFRINLSRSVQLFRKGARKRTRYHCTEIKSGREYMVSALAEVKRAE